MGIDNSRTNRKNGRNRFQLEDYFSMPKSIHVLPQVQLLGEPRILRNNKLELLSDRNAQVLFALLTRPDWFASRQFLAELIWSNDKRGRASLRQFLLRQRKPDAVLSSFLKISDDGVRLVVPRESVDICCLEDMVSTTVRSERNIPSGLTLEGTASPTEYFEELLRAHREKIWAKQWALACRQMENLTRFGNAASEDFDVGAALIRQFAPEKSDAEQFLLSLNIGISRESEKQRVSTSRVKDPKDSKASISADRDFSKLPRLSVAKPDVKNSLVGKVPIQQFVYELAEHLAIFRTFAVVAPNSSFAFSENLAERTQAQYVLQSRLDISSAEAKISFHLEHAPDMRIVWVASLPLNIDELAYSMKRMVRLLACTLAHAVEADIAVHCPNQGEALAAFLNGREHQLRCNLQDVRKARRMFAEATSIDSGYSLAYAKIAETLVTEWILRGGSHGYLLQKARDQAELARQIDPGGASGHWMGATIALYQRRYDQVLENFKIASSLAPHSADLLLEMADANSAMGNSEFAEVAFRRALDLNPAPPDRYWWFGASIALSHGAFQEAALRCDKIHSSEVGLGARVASYALAGQMSKAQKWRKDLEAVLPDITVEHLASLVPGETGSQLRSNYKRGLLKAGLK